MAEIMLLECFKCCQAYYFFWWRILPARLWFGALPRPVTLTTRRTVCFVRESFWTFTLHCWWAPGIWHDMTLFVKFSIWILFRESVVKFQWLFSFVVRGFEMFDTSHGWRSRNIPQNHRKSLAISLLARRLTVLRAFLLLLTLLTSGATCHSGKELVHPRKTNMSPKKGLFQ